ncbi:hypothetical protein JCM3766R1_005424 [Sporobolomyces carnicolor]
MHTYTEPAHPLQGDYSPTFRNEFYAQYSPAVLATLGCDAVITAVDSLPQDFWAIVQPTELVGLRDVSITYATESKDHFFVPRDQAGATKFAAVSSVDTRTFFVKTPSRTAITLPLEVHILPKSLKRLSSFVMVDGKDTSDIATEVFGPNGARFFARRLVLSPGQKRFISTGQNVDFWRIEIADLLTRGGLVALPDLERPLQ